ncbi:MAG: DUF2238 domain-containing protein [Planctomycetota bacterium]
MSSFPPFHKDRVRLTAAIVFAAAMIGFTIFAARNGNSEFLFYAGTMVIMAGVVVAVDRAVRFSPLVIAGLLVWAILHLAGGNVPAGDTGVLYNFRPAPWLPKYDQAVHAFGFAVATLLSWECLRHGIAKRTNGNPRPTFGLVAACALMGMGLGAINEVVEFIAVLTIPDTNVGGYVNTGWDLVSNLSGAVIAGVWIRLRG